MSKTPKITLEMKNFRGIKQGKVELNDVNILIGGNNTGKTTILEALFLAPNPLRETPYTKRAIEILNERHKTLGTQGYTFIHHYYTETPAQITVASREKKIKINFDMGKSKISVSVKDEKTEKETTLGFLGAISNSIEGTAHENEVFLEDSLYFHPSLLKLAWNSLSSIWIRVLGLRITSEIAKQVSSAIGGKYDDITLEPFMAGQITLYMREVDARRIRLGDIGDGIQVFITLRLLYELSKPSLLLIDDVESHMNPRLLGVLANWLADVIERDKVILVASTHSIEAAKLISSLLEDYNPQILLLSIQDGVLDYKRLSLGDVEKLEKIGVDVRAAEGLIL